MCGKLGRMDRNVALSPWPHCLATIGHPVKLNSERIGLNLLKRSNMSLLNDQTTEPVLLPPGAPASLLSDAPLVLPMPPDVLASLPMLSDVPLLPLILPISPDAPTPLPISPDAPTLLPLPPDAPTPLPLPPKRLDWFRVFLCGGIFLLLVFFVVFGVRAAVMGLNSAGSTSGHTINASPSGVTPRSAQSPVSTVTVSQGLLPLKLAYLNASPDLSNNQIHPLFQLTNTGGGLLTLSDVTLRYWYTADSSQQQKVECDYATIGCENVHTALIPINPALPTADTYLEVSFTAVTLTANSTTQIQLRIHRTNWTNYDQSNDYSFMADATKYTANQRIGVYYKGALISGSEP